MIFVLILLLLLANGAFSMAEIALVSASRGKLQQRAEKGDRRATLALALIDSPNRFLSTVQVGITLAGVVLGAFGGAQLAPRFQGLFAGIPFLGAYAYGISFTLVVMGMTFASIVLGELVPKRIAMSFPERVSCLVARPMGWLSILSSPLIVLLSASTDFLLRLLHIRDNAETTVSDDEVRLLIDQGLLVGSFRHSEKEMVDGVLSLDRHNVSDLMTPAPRIVWIDLQREAEANWRQVVASAHSHFPVCAGNQDQVLGMISIKSLWANQSLVGSAHIRDLLTPPLFVPATMPAPKLLETFQQSGKHVALVTDEFGRVQGLVTLIDVLESIVGDLPSRDQPRRQEIRPRADGTWIVDGLTHIDDFLGQLAIPATAASLDQADFTTVAGLVLHSLGHVPAEGERFNWNGWQFEIIDMDRHKIDKVLVTPPADPPRHPSSPA